MGFKSYQICRQQDTGFISQLAEKYVYFFTFRYKHFHLHQNLLAGRLHVHAVLQGYRPWNSIASYINSFWLSLASPCHPCHSSIHMYFRELLRKYQDAITELCFQN